ncbi:MAG: hypothetical protein WCK02_12650 [Bacteroidota bacterium]
MDTQKENTDNKIIDKLIHKYSLKVQVFNNTQTTFKNLKESASQLVSENRKQISCNKTRIPFEYRDKGEFHFELLFGSDVLVFMMHTNVFEFDRNHEVRKTSYIREDGERSYCGLIQVYNFLADSYKYNRDNDLGYLVARLFINKEMHYFIEGKKEIGLLYNSFAVAEMNKEVSKNIIESSMDYSINFDLLTPPFDEVKMVPIIEMKEYSNAMSLKTAKRLGFRFQADKE